MHLEINNDCLAFMISTFGSQTRSRTGSTVEINSYLLYLDVSNFAPCMRHLTVFWPPFKLLKVSSLALSVPVVNVIGGTVLTCSEAGPSADDGDDLC